MTTWLRTTDALARYGVSRSTLYRWRCEGLPHYVVRGSVMYDAVECDRWVRQHGAVTVVSWRRTA